MIHNCWPKKNIKTKQRHRPGQTEMLCLAWSAEPGASCNFRHGWWVWWWSWWRCWQWKEVICYLDRVRVLQYFEGNVQDYKSTILNAIILYNFGCDVKRLCLRPTPCCLVWREWWSLLYEGRSSSLCRPSLGNDGSIIARLCVKTIIMKINSLFVLNSGILHITVAYCRAHVGHIRDRQHLRLKHN